MQPPTIEGPRGAGDKGAISTVAIRCEETLQRVLWSVYASLIGKSSIPRSTVKRTTRDAPMNEKPTILE